MSKVLTSKPRLPQFRQTPGYRILSEEGLYLDPHEICFRIIFEISLVAANFHLGRLFRGLKACQELLKLSKDSSGEKHLVSGQRAN